MPLVVVRVPLGLAGAHGQQRLGSVERLDLRLLVDAKHQGPVGRIEVETDDVADLLHEQRIGRQLNVSERCGCSEKALQMRCTVVTDRPLARAIDRRLQCVAPGGVLSSVAVTTSAILSSPILRGAPGLGSSLSPSRRRLAKRLRHVVTVTRVTPSRAAMAVLLSPAAASSTMAARCASARAVLRRRARISSSPRSSSLNAIATAARPRIRSSHRYPRRANHIAYRFA